MLAPAVRTTLPAPMFSTLVLSGCAHSGETGTNAPTTSLAFPAASGARQARRDIAAGKLQLMEAGTGGVYTPKVPANDARYSKLPRHLLRSGCTISNATSWIRYAEGYNAVVVLYLQKQAK
jgi:hypothetical protein